MFFPVQNKDGKKALINLDQIFAFVENGKDTIALSTGGSTFEIPMKLDDLEIALEELEDEDNVTGGAGPSYGN
jgi:hypothetical protein